MIAMPPPARRFRIRPLVWVGLTTSVLGSAPLLLVIAASTIGLLDDPNPNPVGLGILAGFTFWPGIAMTLIGAVLSVVDFRRSRADRSA
jgi:hypothetical protein